MIKDIIDKIIQDLGDDKPIKGILLKAQIVASQLNNKEFEEWIKSEQNGYSDAKNLPDYRVLGAIVKANVFQPYIVLDYTKTVQSLLEYLKMKLLTIV